MKIGLAVLVAFAIVAVPQLAYAAEFDDEKLSLAAGLEETLGHFRALELNLEDGNTTLALTHAYHPISELYDAMHPILDAADPDLDAQMKSTLENLRNTANTDVPLDQAKMAINDARALVEQARISVVGADLSDNRDFKLLLIRNLLDTAVIEYYEAVSDGEVINVPELQDGSAFVWRSQQIFDEVKSELESYNVDEIEAIYKEIKEDYETRADPEDVELLTNGITNKIEIILDIQDHSKSPSEYIESIKMLLADAKTAYDAGDQRVGISLATQAYLDHFEFLEGPLIKAGELEFMEKVEKMFREDLRSQMKQGAPAEQVDAIILEIQENLIRVEEILSEPQVDDTVSYQEKIDLGHGLEEALGHFRALELNLDAGDGALAMTHAYHPIAELYDAMHPIIAKADPALDMRVQSVLENLHSTASVDVPRDQAQMAIDEAKDIIAQTKSIVIGDALSSDKEFRLLMIKGLLDTAVAEYYEAVSDGQVINVPELQDGSAFVWRSQQIFDDVKSELESYDVEEIEAIYDGIQEDYDTIADPQDVELLTHGITNKIDIMLDIQDKEKTSSDYIASIRMLLADAKTAYDAGDQRVGVSLATQAYLDHFEFLEGPLIKAGELEFMEKVEIMFREDLRGQMKQGAPAEQVNETILEIQGHLVTVEQILGIADAIQYLEEAKAAYGSGDVASASILVDQAKTSYSVANDGLSELDSELATMLDSSLDDIASSISANTSPAEFDSQVDAILENLDVAQKVVPEFGTIAVLILAVSIVSLVVVSRTRPGLMPRV